MAGTPPTREAFLAQYPTFTNAPAALVDAKLADAAARTNAGAWGDSWTMGVMLRAADLLAKTPEGRRLRLVQADGKSIYADDLRTLTRRVAIGLARTT